jgi:hypothetical protein
MDRRRMLRRRQRLYGLDLLVQLLPVIFVLIVAVCIGGGYLLLR